MEMAARRGLDQDAAQHSRGVVMQCAGLQGSVARLSAAPSTQSIQPGHRDGLKEKQHGGAPGMGGLGAPLVGKQRLEKLIIARPPGFRTRCISSNTCAPPNACS